QREVAMQAVNHEPRPPRRAPAPGVDDAHHHARREEDEADCARAPREVPHRGRAAGREDCAHAASAADGQPPTTVAAPPGATSRAGRPRSASQAGAAVPRTMAAVLAVFASTQEAAATLAARHTSRAGRPVAGSTM